MKMHSFLSIIYIQLNSKKYESNMKLFLHFQGLKLISDKTFSVFSLSANLVK